MVVVNISLNDEERLKLILDLSREMADNEYESSKDLKPEDISEFRFLHKFGSVEEVVERYSGVDVMHRSGDSFYRSLSCLNTYRLSNESLEDGLRKFGSQLQYPVNLGVVYIPGRAVHQDRIFKLGGRTDKFEKGFFSAENLQKSKNWRGNVLTVILDPETEPKIDCLVSALTDKRAVLATFKKNDNGLYVVDQYFMKK